MILVGRTITDGPGSSSDSDVMGSVSDPVDVSPDADAEREEGLEDRLALSGEDVADRCSRNCGVGCSGSPGQSERA